MIPNVPISGSNESLRCFLFSSNPLKASFQVFPEKKSPTFVGPHLIIWRRKRD